MKESDFCKSGPSGCVGEKTAGAGVSSQAYISVTLGPPVQPDLTMSASRHLVILTATLGLVSSQDCSAVGYFPHPSDCSQFYRCTDIWSTGQYQQYDFQCAEGTVFDASIRKVFHLQFLICLARSPTLFLCLSENRSGGPPTPPPSPPSTLSSV